MAEHGGFRFRQLLDSGLVIAVASLIWWASGVYYEHQQIKADLEDIKQELKLRGEDRLKLELWQQRVDLALGLPPPPKPSVIRTGPEVP